MEAEEVRQLTAILKYRSSYKCVREGISFVLKRFPLLARFLWPMALVYIVFTLIMFFVQRSMAGDIALGAVWPAQFYVLLASLAACVSAVLVQSGIVWQQRKLVEQGSLASVRLRGVWRDVLSTFWRLLRLVVVLGVAFFVVASVLVMLLSTFMSVFHATETVSVGHWLLAVAAWVVVVCLLVLMLGVVYHVFYEYALGGVSMRDAFLSVGWSRRYLGRTIVVVFVTALLSVVLGVLVSLPAMVCSHIDGIALATQLNGDDVQLPSAYLWLRLLSWFFSAVGGCLCFLLVSFPMCFNWGAIRTTESERQAKE